MSTYVVVNKSAISKSDLEDLQFGWSVLVQCDKASAVLVLAVSLDVEHAVESTLGDVDLDLHSVRQTADDHLGSWEVRPELRCAVCNGEITFRKNCSAEVLNFLTYCKGLPDLQSSLRCTGRWLCGWWRCRRRWCRTSWCRTGPGKYCSSVRSTCCRDSQSPRRTQEEEVGRTWRSIHVCLAHSQTRLGRCSCPSRQRPFLSPSHTRSVLFRPPSCPWRQDSWCSRRCGRGRSQVGRCKRQTGRAQSPFQSGKLVLKIMNFN